MTHLTEEQRGLVKRLRQYDGEQFETTACYNGVRDEAAREIEALAARVEELNEVIGHAFALAEKLASSGHSGIRVASGVRNALLGHKEKNND